MITVLLVDDQAIVRRALRMRLSVEPDLAVLDEAPDGRSALALVEQLRPDVVVMDVAMPGLDGIDATATLKARHPRVAVVVLSLNTGEATKARAMAAGAAAFVEKPASGPYLVAAIRQAVHSERESR